MSDLYKDVSFKDLFDNERQAVVCYLSLEKRYIKLAKHLEKTKDLLSCFSDDDIHRRLQKRSKENK